MHDLALSTKLYLWGTWLSNQKLTQPHTHTHNTHSTHLSTVCCPMMNSSLIDKGLMKLDHSVSTSTQHPLRVRSFMGSLLKGCPMDSMTGKRGRKKINFQGRSIRYLCRKWWLHSLKFTEKKNYFSGNLELTDQLSKPITKIDQLSKPITKIY